MHVADELVDVAEKADRGESLDRADAERVMAARDLVSVGVMGEAARRRVSGEIVTFGRVCEIAGEGGGQRGAAGEVRITGRPASIDEACRWVRSAAAIAAGTPLTAFSLADLRDICGASVDVLREAAGSLRAAGLEAVAEVPIDRFASTLEALTAVRAITEAGLQAWRWTIDRAGPDTRLDLLMRAAELQAATGAARAFAPLPRHDSSDMPSTGYDDVRTVAVARLVCPAIACIQVDWPLYGPKLAQVAITFGANDIDGIAASDAADLGPRRAPVEDISRQIRAAAGVPAERNGRYERRP
jgi:aminodeoxyfutalosine synthase